MLLIVWSGVWDFYTEKPSWRVAFAQIPGSLALTLENTLAMRDDLPYLRKLLRDIFNLRRCWFYLAVYLATQIASAAVPAISLWFSGQLLKIVQTAVDTRTVDRDLLFRISAGRILCVLLGAFLRHFSRFVSIPLQETIRQHYDMHVFRALARLDAPAFDDPAVQAQAAAAWPRGHGSVAWGVLERLVGLGTRGAQVAGQLGMLARVVRDLDDGPALAALSFLPMALEMVQVPRLWSNAATWAATPASEDYVRAVGMKAVVEGPAHRKEVIAGDMQEHLVSEYEKALLSAGIEAKDFQGTKMTWEFRAMLRLSTLLREPLKELPQIVFTLSAAAKPASIPVSLASLSLIQRTAGQIDRTLRGLGGPPGHGGGTMAESLSLLRKLYDIEHVARRVQDGRAPYPEEKRSLQSGMTVEFRNVSFSYPGSDRYALRDVSFSIPQGGLCVIVGGNGSGKSTCLKLIARLYDPDAGEILIDGRNIKELKLSDLRRAISVLFQDFSHFPLSIKENIGLGDPANAQDEERIQQAAKLGGADEFIEELPDGYDTYLRRPVPDVYSQLPEGTKTLFGKTVNFRNIRRKGELRDTREIILSGGQMQRLAVARTFMRSLPSSQDVGMLLFDEPSASLDPVAEADLFERLRGLRGEKTMIFSSHRLGGLTRHADLILYMKDAQVVEAGTHDSLLRREGEYARIWNIQAQAFA